MCYGEIDMEENHSTGGDHNAVDHLRHPADPTIKKAVKY
jgi:hypothetical protein